jgi:hypothetical protein
MTVARTTSRCGAQWARDMCCNSQRSASFSSIRIGVRGGMAPTKLIARRWAKFLVTNLRDAVLSEDATLVIQRYKLPVLAPLIVPRPAPASPCEPAREEDQTPPGGSP